MLLGWSVLLAGAEEARPLHEKLALFAPILGKTFSGEIKQSTAEQPMVDVVRYERALNGTAVRSFHSINDGDYGGETLMRWDDDAQKIVFHYFTTEGFMTSGHLEPRGDVLYSYETVANPEKAGGVTAVEAETTISAEEITVKSWYLIGDEKIPGHTAVYHPAPEAKVNFR